MNTGLDQYMDIFKDAVEDLSRSAGLPPLSPSRTVHATFTAHGSCNSVNYFSFLNNRLCVPLGTAFEWACTT